MDGEAVEYSILSFSFSLYLSLSIFLSLSLSLSLSLTHTHTPHLAARDEKERFGIVGVPGRMDLAHAHRTIDVYRTAVALVRYPR
jgi:hypothetical protein